jgi:hypothetical protein
MSGQRAIVSGRRDGGKASRPGVDCYPEQVRHPRLRLLRRPRHGVPLRVRPRNDTRAVEPRALDPSAGGRGEELCKNKANWRRVRINANSFAGKGL